TNVAADTESGWRQKSKPNSRGCPHESQESVYHPGRHRRRTRFHDVTRPDTYSGYPNEPRAYGVTVRARS
ncbi:MAG: hypothetical protein PVI22_14110, partial [Lysobacterales bacterium]